MFFYRNNGYTLIEIVVSLTLLGVLAVSLIQFVSTGITYSGASVLAVKQQFALAEVMEKMTADYKWMLLTDANPLETFKKRVETGNNPSQVPYFGDYSVNTKYIEFIQDGVTYKELSEPCFTDCNMLKVSVRYGFHRLTAIFTR